MILRLISSLADPVKRYENGRRLAAYLACAYLLVFIKDPEIGLLLPAPGFPQTLPFDARWEHFLSQTADDKFFTGDLPYPVKEQLLPATGIAVSGECIAILLGGKPSQEQLQPLTDALPILAALFLQEQKTIAAQISASFAENNAVKAERMAKTIDGMRIKLKDALVKQERDKKAIEELLMKKDEFINIASHELKTPMTSIKGYLQLLSKNNVDKQKFDTFLRKANLQADKVADLVADLLDVSKIQSGRMALNIAEFNFLDIVEHVTEEIQLTSQRHQIEISAKADAIVCGDKMRLEQVVTNLLTNAIKYSPQADRVLISLSNQGKGVKLEVTDFGIGIEEEKISQVFDRFYRADDVISKFSGLGLGLFISKEIVLRHEGNIGVISRPKEGSTFWVTLPAVA